MKRIPLAILAFALTTSLAACGPYQLSEQANLTGLKGVTFHRVTGKWQAAIQVNRKSHHLGLFETADAAHAAYVASAAKLHGEFACTGARAS